MFRFNVIFGIFLRNVQSYFSGILGYLIIVAFVTVCALLAFSQAFFANNDASLDQLSSVYPWLLLFFVPAITMGAWANERKSGTDVLLFTLPASDWEILLGKYLAVCAVYTIALLFSVTQLIALQSLGQPDWSVVLSTYYGYWISGLALLSIGLFASSLTRDSAAAFVLGMIFCSVPVLTSYFVQGIPKLESLSVQNHVDQFSNGVIYFHSLFYFGAMILLFLYLNHVVIARRLWVRFGQQFMLANYVLRGLALLVFLVAGYFLLDRLSGRYPAYLDLTAENLYTLDETTVDTIEQAAGEGTQVTLEAYISEDVPAEFVPVKKQLQTLLSQYDRLGGGTVILNKVMVQPTSEEANQAEAAGIDGTVVREKVAGKSVEQKVYLGAVVKTENGETILPNFDGATSIEYEITRAVAALSGPEEKLTVAILDTDMKFTGLDVQGQGIDLEFGRINNELKKFYNLRPVNSDDLQEFVQQSKGKLSSPQDAEGSGAELESKIKLPDVLMVPGVSSLDQATMDLLVEYIEAGKPVLLLDDPVPFFFPTYTFAGQMGILRGPAQERLSPGTPLSEFMNSSTAPKGSLEKLESALGIRWNPTRIVWNSTAAPDSFSLPMPMGAPESTTWPEGYGSRQNALVFFRGGAEDKTTFNDRVAGANNLRDVLMFYAGTFEPAAGSPFDFIPWVSTDPKSGTLEYDQYSETVEVVTPTWDPQQNRQVNTRTEQINPWSRSPERKLVDAAGVADPNVKPLPVVAQIVGNASEPRNVILISDLDFMSDLAFACAAVMPKGLDNVQLLQNAIETLADDQRFIALRGRRAKLRPLEQIDAVKRVARQKRLDGQAELERQLQEKLAEAQTKLDQRTAELEANEDLSFFERLQMTATAASEEQRKFDRIVKNAEKEFETEINSLEVEEKTTIEQRELWTRFFAVLLPPLPALALGIAVVLIGLVKQSRSHR